MGLLDYNILHTIRKKHKKIYTYIAIIVIFIMKGRELNARKRCFFNRRWSKEIGR